LIVSRSCRSFLIRSNCFRLFLILSDYFQSPPLFSYFVLVLWNNFQPGNGYVGWPGQRTLAATNLELNAISVKL
jgi:hypothetical protein